ncbi:hypothetical protein K457DRAFT_14209 [Linnemannia elongata AG-77]|uniref:Uncharacterized protein n=1 Tax=Linnemannia elongata AG-77 TaxID=1314771 RepID=A0A197KA48_9FUNG|nr:hypothetical protein K457DRAFT_14209 [Linnemannia elongata AG-77]
MKHIPADATSRHSHLCGILQVIPSYERKFDLAPFNCIHLISANIQESCRQSLVANHLAIYLVAVLHSRKFSAPSRLPSPQEGGVTKEVGSNHGDNDLDIGGVWDMDLLARSLRGSCPDFHSLMFDDSRVVRDLEALIRHCSTSGLRKLHTMVFGPEDTPISSILQHSATLEDLLLCRRESGWERNGRSCTQTAAAGYLRLLTGCPKLTRFSLILSGGPLDRDLVDTLQEQIWACRGLQELELKIGFFKGSGRPMIARVQESIEFQCLKSFKL